MLSNFRILHIGYCPRAYAATSTQHYLATSDYSEFEVVNLVNLGRLPRWLNLERFDAVIVHYSIYLAANYLPYEDRKRLGDFKGVKVLSIQDEYRHVLRTIECIREIDFDILLTCVPTQEIEKVYPQRLVRARKINVLTGYVPNELLDRETRPIAERPLDLGYRARKLPEWYGELAREKWTIVDELKARLPANLKTDLSYREDDRIYGDAWFEFIQSCRAVVGVESGANVFDFTGDIQKQADHLQFELHAEADEVARRVTTGLDGKVRLNQISPRCFEAAVLQTPMILFEGEYSGVLHPWRHYIPLKKDYSNLDEVLKCLADTEFLEKIARTTYREIALNPNFSYKAYVAMVDLEMKKEFVSRGMKPRRIAAQPALKLWLGLRNEIQLGRFQRLRVILNVFDWFADFGWFVSQLVGPGLTFLKRRMRLSKVEA